MLQMLSYKATLVTTELKVFLTGAYLISLD